MESDLYNLFFCMSKEDVCRYLFFKPYKSIEEAQKELNIRLKESKYYAITLLNKKYIGEIYLSKDDDAYEIRFLLDDLYWKNGYMTEAIVAVTNYFIENKGAYKFIAHVNKNNIAACNVLERVGFLKVKETNDIVYEL